MWLGNYLQFIYIKQKGLPQLKVPFLVGCLTGFEPVIDDPQSSVLPLHHRHHERADFITWGDGFQAIF